MHDNHGAAAGPVDGQIRFFQQSCSTELACCIATVPGHFCSRQLAWLGCRPALTAICSTDHFVWYVY